MNSFSEICFLAFQILYPEFFKTSDARKKILSGALWSQHMMGYCI